MRKQTNRICCLLPFDSCSVSPSNTNQTTKIESLNHDKCILCQIPHSEISYLVFRYTFLFHHLESVPVVLLHRPEWKNPLQVRDVSLSLLLTLFPLDTPAQSTKDKLPNASSRQDRPASFHSSPTWTEPTTLRIKSNRSNNSFFVLF